MKSSTKARDTSEARYREIERYFRSLSDAGSPGDLLPSEADVCKQFGVSRMTVRQALQELTNSGFIERRRGQGTFIASRPVHRRPGVFLSFTEEMMRRGLKPSSRLLSAAVESPRPSERADLGLGSKANVVRVVRVRLADGTPVALEDAALLPEFADIVGTDLAEASLHGALAARGVVATRAVGTITARLARASEINLLDLPQHAALLVELRILFDQQGRAFERTETRYVADRYVIDVVHSHP